MGLFPKTAKIFFLGAMFVAAVACGDDPSDSTASPRQKRPWSHDAGTNPSTLPEANTTPVDWTPDENRDDNNLGSDAGAPVVDGASNEAPDATVPSPQPASADEFVSVDRTRARLMLKGAPFNFAGTNYYWLVQQRAYNHASVPNALSAAKELGLRAIRVWGFHDGTSTTDGAIIQKAPRQLNETALRAMDAIIAQAASHNIKIVFPLTNYWNGFGGMAQYVAWANKKELRLFYTDDTIKTVYKYYIANILNRTNTITGRAYKEDPTILAWEIANSARAPGDASGAELAAWYEEIATHIKTIDTHHLVATGEEGFDCDGSQYSSAYDNGYPLSGGEGTCFSRNIAIKNIDYASMHLAPKSLGFTSAESFTTWIRDHADIARRAGKPLVISHYGADDKTVYAAWLKQAEISKIAGDFLYELRPAGRTTGDPTDVVHPTDTAALAVLRQHAATMNKGL